MDALWGKRAILHRADSLINHSLKAHYLLYDAL
jgi:hypothetical protein